MNYTDFRTAVILAKEGEFKDFGFYNEVKSKPTTTKDGYTFGGYYNNWVGLYFDANSGYFSLQLTERGWMLCYDDKPICAVSREISDALDEKRRWELGAAERDLVHRREYEDERSWMFRHHNYGML